MNTRIFSLMIAMMPIMAIAQQKLSIIPKPVSLNMTAGSFTIDANTAIQYSNTNIEIQPAIKFFVAAIKNISGLNLPINISKKKWVRFKIEPIESIGEEGYLLAVTPTDITISAKNKAGIIYGIQSLLQTLPAVRTNASLTIPCMNIKDYPRFKYRGMHLDVSRHFFGPDVVKEYINLMASYKMNVFHWHLVDDQGWRIEIKKYPLLTKTGAWRVDYTNMVWGSRPQAKAGEEATYGGYYTQEQIKDIIAYASERNITIIPEIEMPGHVASAIASYPELSCKQQIQLPLTGGDYHNSSSNYCAGNDSVFAFLENVLSEVITLFPSPYIHVGGDEVEKGSWKLCAKCQARIKKEGLKDENELQSYFIKRIEKFIVGKKRKMIGWDEILEGGLAPEAIVMSWRGEAGGIEAAKMKHDVVMTPGNPVYFDHYQAGPEGEPLAIGGMNTLKKVYDYEPIPNELNKTDEKYVLGAQANLWTEFISTTEQLEYMILPRISALAEVLWTQKESKNWDDFNGRLQNHFVAYGQKGLRFCPGNFTVNIIPNSQNGKITVSLSSEIMNSEILYTLDGTEPNRNSFKYSTPIEIKESSTIKASTAINGMVKSLQATKQNYLIHKAMSTNVTYTNPFSKFYTATGPNTLTDGIRGTDAISKNWHGFSEKDMIATVDLGIAKNVKSISLGCLQNFKSWIFLPQYVKFEGSIDGINFQEINKVSSPFSIEEPNMLFDFKISFPVQSFKYIRITAKNNLCPPTHPGAGKPGWLFTDEIIVE